jgi:hypothetical protein
LNQKTGGARVKKQYAAAQARYTTVAKAKKFESKKNEKF